MPQTRAQATAATITLKAEERVWELPRPGSWGAAIVGHCLQGTGDAGKQTVGNVRVLDPSTPPRGHGRHTGSFQNMAKRASPEEEA